MVEWLRSDVCCCGLDACVENGRVHVYIARYSAERVWVRACVCVAALFLRTSNIPKDAVQNGPVPAYNISNGDLCRVFDRQFSEVLLLFFTND